MCFVFSVCLTRGMCMWVVSVQYEEILSILALSYIFLTHTYIYCPHTHPHIHRTISLRQEVLKPGNTYSSSSYPNLTEFFKVILFTYLMQFSILKISNENDIRHFLIVYSTNATRSYRSMENLWSHSNIIWISVDLKIWRFHE